MGTPCPHHAWNAPCTLSALPQTWTINKRAVHIELKCLLVTAHKRSYGKVMFLHLSVSHSVQMRGMCPSMQWAWKCVLQHAIRDVCQWGQTPDLGRHPRGGPMKRVVRILLEFILVLYCVHLSHQVS